MIAAIVAACFAGGAHHETKRQADAAIHANRISNASFISTQRAYMYFAGVNTRKAQSADGAFAFWIAPTIGNSGNTPTIDLFSRANCSTNEKVESDPFEHLLALKMDWTAGLSGPRAVLQATECSLSLDRARNIMNGRLHYYLAGGATYKDFVAKPYPSISLNSQSNSRLANWMKEVVP
jgi:hypothetical protein